MPLEHIIIKITDGIISLPTNSGFLNYKIIELCGNNKDIDHDYDLKKPIDMIKKYSETHGPVLVKISNISYAKIKKDLIPKNAEQIYFQNTQNFSIDIIDEEENDYYISPNDGSSGLIKKY